MKKSSASNDGPRKSTKLGSFLRGSFLRSSLPASSSSRSVPSSVPRKPQKASSLSAVSSSASTKERQGRERTPRISSSPNLFPGDENTANRNTNTFGSSIGTRKSSPSTSCSSSNNLHHHLRSKSPSRQRIEQFMEGVRAGERARSASRHRSSLKSSPEQPHHDKLSHRSLSGKLSLSQHSSYDQPISSNKTSPSHTPGRSSHSRGEESKSSITPPPQSSSSQDKLQNYLDSKHSKKSPRGHSSSRDDGSLSVGDSIDTKSFYSTGTKSTGGTKTSSLSPCRHFHNASPTNSNPTTSVATAASSTRSSKSNNDHSQRARRSSGSPADRTTTTSAVRRSLFPKKTGLGSPVSAMVDPSTNSDDPEAWFSAIRRRDWNTLDVLIRSYDYKKYRSKDSNTTNNNNIGTTPPPPKKGSGKKLRVLKYLPSKDQNSKAATTSNSGSDEEEEEDNHEEEQPVGPTCPLLVGDAVNGQTPLHLACKNVVPCKLLQSLFFLERKASSVTDKDGRLPLHLALIASHDTKIIDRFIHAHPNSLQHVDQLSRTPMGYAILRAQHKGTKARPTSWRIPITQQEKDLQDVQTDNWKNVEFLLEAFVARRKLLSKSHEASLLLETVQAAAPPSVVNNMLSVAARILQRDLIMAGDLFQRLIRLDYPLSIWQKALRICSETMSPPILMNMMQKGIIPHYDRGCTRNKHREETHQNITFRAELLQCHQRKLAAKKEPAMPSPSCQEWWEKLKFLIGYSHSVLVLKTPQTLEEAFLLHDALQIPESPPGLVELLLRLFPQSRFLADPATDALPIHLACQWWHGHGTWDHERSTEASQVMKGIVSGDASLARKKYRRRYPLHIAILANQSWRFIQTILALNTKLLCSPDPWTRLYPFQLAAMKKSSLPISNVPPNNHNLDVIFQLLRMNPIAIQPLLACGSGDPKGDLGPVAEHVLRWCYACKNHDWVLNPTRSQALRNAITLGDIPTSNAITTWFEQLKAWIWKVYDGNMVCKRLAYLPHDDVYLAHAAILNGGTPPIAIELLLKLYPSSITTPFPGSTEYLLHLAAKSPSYIPMPFEIAIGTMSILELIVQCSPATIPVAYKKRTILQIAMESGKTWPELGPVIQRYPTLLQTKDPCTGLFPFQQMASVERYPSLPEWIQGKIFATKWTDRTPAENGAWLGRLRREYHQEQTTTIYELLRRQPQALTMSVGPSCCCTSS